MKDRSVAVYLKKLLSGEEESEVRGSKANNEAASENSESRDRGFLSRGLLNPEFFSIGFAMGFKSKNIVNKAYRALNTEKLSMYQDVLGQLPSVRSIKLS